LTDELVFRPKPSILGAFSIFAAVFGTIFCIWLFINSLSVLIGVYVFNIKIGRIFFAILAGLGILMMLIVLSILLPLTPIILNKEYIQGEKTIIHMISGSGYKIYSNDIKNIKVHIVKSNRVELIEIISVNKDIIQFIDTITQNDLTKILDFLTHNFNKQIFDIKKEVEL
jgi:hypothetical protein